MPAPYPEEFRRRAIALVVEEGQPAAQVARDLDIAESGLRRWVQQAKIDSGDKAGLTTSERDELVRLRREVRTLKMERDLLSRAAAFNA